MITFGGSASVCNAETLATLRVVKGLSRQASTIINLNVAPLFSNASKIFLIETVVPAMLSELSGFVSGGQNRASPSTSISARSYKGFHRPGYEPDRKKAAQKNMRLRGKTMNGYEKRSLSVRSITQQRTEGETHCPRNRTLSKKPNPDFNPFDVGFWNAFAVSSFRFSDDLYLFFLFPP